MKVDYNHQESKASASGGRLQSSGTEGGPGAVKTNQRLSKSTHQAAENTWPTEHYWVLGCKNIKKKKKIGRGGDGYNGLFPIVFGIFSFILWIPTYTDRLLSLHFFFHFHLGTYV